MLISYKHNFLFIHNPKVAGCTIEETLRKTIFTNSEFLNYKIDWACQRINFRLKNRINLRNPFYNDPVKWIYDSFKAPQGYLNPHASAQQIKSVLGDEKYKQLFKFVFVRNPWDFEVSLYKYTCWRKLHPLHDLVKSMSFEEYLKWRFKQGKGLQQRFFTDENGNILVDFLGKFESLQSDYDKICDILNIPQKELPFLNKSKNRKEKDYRTYYNEETKNLIYENLKEDIELFGYHF